MEIYDFILHVRQLVKSRKT